MRVVEDTGKADDFLGYAELNFDQIHIGGLAVWLGDRRSTVNFQALACKRPRGQGQKIMTCSQLTSSTVILPGFLFACFLCRL